LCLITDSNVRPYSTVPDHR